MKSKRILVIDDEKHMQMLLKFNLQKTGCIVDTAGGGVAALSMIGEETPDLILVDLVMTEMDGFETVRELRKLPQCRETPVIMLTSRGQVDAREQAANLGISVFLTKPFSPMELTREASRLLGL